MRLDIIATAISGTIYISNYIILIVTYRMLISIFRLKLMPLVYLVILYLYFWININIISNKNDAKWSSTCTRKGYSS